MISNFVRREYKRMIADIGDRYIANPTYKEIKKLAKEYKVHPHTIYRYLHESGAKIRRPQAPRSFKKQPKLAVDNTVKKK